MNSKLYIIVSLIFFIFLSCKSDSEKEIKKQDNTRQTINSGGPKFQFDELIHDFGTVTRGERVVIDFNFTNIGGKDLIINEVKTSCGCTLVDFSKKPVKPNEKSSIQIVFDSEGFRGTQYKTITVIANTNPQETELSFTAVVYVP